MVSYHTARVGPGERGRKKSNNLIWIQLGLRLEFSKKKKKARSPCNGNHFSSISAIHIDVNF